MPIIKKKSAYSQMYLVTPGVYEKLLRCLDDGDKRVLDDFNNPPNEDVRESERELQGLGAMDVYQNRPSPGFDPGPSFSQRFEPRPSSSKRQGFTDQTREAQHQTEQGSESSDEQSENISMQSGPVVIYGQPTSTSRQIAISEDTPLAQLRKIKKSKSHITKKPIARIITPDFLRTDSPRELLYSEPMTGIEYDRPAIQQDTSTPAPLPLEYITQNNPTQIKLSEIRRQMKDEAKNVPSSLKKVIKGKVLKKSGLIEDAPIRRLGGQIKFVPSKIIPPARQKCTDKGSGQMCTVYNMPPSQKFSQKIYACDICSKQFKRRSYLMRHIEKHHSTNEPGVLHPEGVHVGEPHVSYPDDESIADIGEYAEPYPVDPAEIEGTSGILAIEGTPVIEGTSRLAIEGKPALQFQSWAQQKKPKKLKVTKRLAIEGPLAIEGISATSSSRNNPRTLKGSRKLAIQGPLAIEGTLPVEGVSRPAIEFESWSKQKIPTKRSGKLVSRPDVSFQSWAIGRSRLGKKRTITKTKFPDPFKQNRPTKVSHQE